MKSSPQISQFYDTALTTANLFTAALESLEVVQELDDKVLLILLG